MRKTFAYPLSRRRDREMKKKNIYYSIKLPPLRLYLDDIDEINSILETDYKDYNIETTEYELESLHEVKDLKEDKIDSLTFKSLKPYISLKFAYNGTTLVCEEDDTKSVGILSKIKAILDKRTLSIKFVDNNWFGILLISGIFILLFLAMLSGKTMLISKEYTYSLFISTFTYLGVVVLIAFLMDLVTNRKHTLIYISYKKERPNFFVRNKDGFILVLIGALLGSMFGAFFTYILYKLNILG